MKTKLFTLLLAVAASVGTMYASNTQVDGIWYDFDSSSKSATVTYRGSSYSAYSDEYTGLVAIPASVTYNNVKYSVTSIGSSAFYGCTGLTSVTIPNSVTSIGDYAFYGCSINAINFIGSIEDWCNKTWSPGGISHNYQLYLNGELQKEIIIPNSVPSIGNYAFSGCTGLTSVTIPNSVTSIGSSAFDGCSGLTSITIPNSVTSIGDGTFLSCTGLTSVTIGNSVTSIGSRAFQNCSGLTSVTIPNSVTSIGESAFNGCSGLTSVVWNAKNYSNCDNHHTPFYYDGYISTNNYDSKRSFDLRSQITSFTFGNEVEHIPANLCNGMSNLTSVTIPNSVTSIGSQAFWGCWGLTSVTIGNSVTSIGVNAFAYCSGLTSVTIPNSVTSIGSYAFQSCSSLTSVTIGSSVTSIGAYAFYSCERLTSVTIGNSVIGVNAFAYCSGLTSIDIPNSVTSIGNYAFRSCSSLTSVTIGSSVTSIGAYAFYSCERLTSVTIEAETPPTLGSCAFDYTNNCPIYVPCGTLDAYKTAWSSVASKIYTAPFPYTITTNAENGTVSTTSTKSYTICDVSATITCTATPDNGYHFTQWSDGIITNPRTIILTQDTIFTAEFAKNTYTISTTSANPEWGTTAGGKSALYLDGVEISATANYGYHFVKWDDNNTENPRIVSVTKDATYTATFAKNTYSITKIANSTQGSISGSSKAEYLDNVTLTATPQDGYHFTQWSDGIITNPRTFVLTQDTTFTAEFAKNTYTISTTSANQEWGTTAGDKSVLYLENVVISATANYGYHFVKWNDNNTENPRTISVTKDATYTATFAKNTYSITKNANSTQGSISGVSNAEYLDNVTLTVNPNYGYHFTQWNDGHTDNPRTFVLTQDTTFTAEFAVDKSGTCGKDNLLQWTFADDGTLTISGNGELTENYTFGVEAPTQMQQLVIGNEVTSIGERAFYEKTTLQKLIIGSNVTSIGKYAFASINNRQLTSLVMPAELLTIGDYAFSGNTYVESIDFNAKLQSIGAYAFKDCYRVSEMTCLATVTPNVGTEALASINSYASLCVPAECLRKYQVDPNWGRFDLCELGTTSTVTENRTVTVEPTDNTAIFTWPTENNAASYSLQITKDGVVFCTLVFNSNGQLTGIAFAPGRNGAAHAPAATMSVAGMSFTVTGLDGASKYAYRLAVTNDASEELVAYSGEFATTGYNGEVNPGGNPEGIDNTPFPSGEGRGEASKILHNGTILILRGDKTYTLQGQEVK